MDAVDSQGNQKPGQTQFQEDLERINRMTDELREASDRTRAVLIGAEIDRYLKQMLEAYLLPQTSKSSRLLDSSSGLGTFTARIEIAYRLGLLRPEWHHDLQIIGEIRDAFAHGAAGLTLSSSQSLSSQCSNLIHGKKWIEDGRKIDPNAGDNPQTRFVASGVVILAHLCIVRSSLRRVPEHWKSYPEDPVEIVGPDHFRPQSKTSQ